MKNNTYDENDFKTITSNPIVLDFKNCNNWQQIHSILKESFGFPDCYGRNWNALWDFMNEVFYFNNTPYTIEIHGINTLTKEYQNYCEKMLEVFEEVHKEMPYITFKLIS